MYFLCVDFVVVEEVFIEARRVVSLDAAMGFKVVTATFLETEEIGVGDGFAAGSKVVTHWRPQHTQGGSGTSESCPHVPQSLFASPSAAHVCLSFCRLHPNDQTRQQQAFRPFLE